MKNKKSKLLALLSVLPVLMFVSACSAPRTFEKYNYDIRVDSVFKGSSIEVDLVGVNASELPRFESMSVTEYWQPGNSIRNSTIPPKMRFRFPSNKKIALSKNDPIWEKWRGRDVKYIIFIADLPGIMSDRHGSVDSRRLILPVDWRQWENKIEEDGEIVIELGANGIVSLPSPGTVE
jgi:hypothetical protein